MMRKILAAVMCFAATSPLAAQTSCDLQKATQIVGDYAANPFSARTWRVLKGLGDPGVAPASGADRWEAENRFRDIAAKAAPNVPLPNNIAYDCRIEYPLDVLNWRASALGDKHPYVEQWVRSQLAIFAACGGDQTATLPSAIQVEGLAPNLQQDDRAYQQAALTFYTNRDKALDLFKAIAISNSEHRAAARYMVANIFANAKRVAKARSEAKAILADQSLSSVHAITQSLLGYIANVEDTAEGWTELIDNTIAVLERPADQIAASDKLKADYARALTDIDFAGIRAKSDDWWLDGKLPENPTISKAIVDASRTRAIVPWMIAGQTAQTYYNAGGWALIGPQWQERASSLITRAMALTSGTPELARDVIGALAATPAEGEVNALLGKASTVAKDAEASCGEAPAAAASGTLTFHAVRTAAMAGRFEDAYKLLEAYPFKTAPHYRNTVLQLGRYMLGQGQLEEARRFRDRLLTQPFLDSLAGDPNPGVKDQFATYLSWIAEDEARFEAALKLHARRTELPILNFLSVKDLQKMAANEAVFTMDERAVFARAAWTREYGLGRKPGKAASDAFYKLNPAIAEIAAEVEEDYPKATDAQRRLLTILRSPRFNTLVNAPGQWQPLAMTDVTDVETLDQYDHNDRNWWCPFEPDRHLGALRKDFGQAAGTAIEFWTEDDLKPVLDPATAQKLDEAREVTLKRHPVIREVAWKEIASLAAMPGAPRRLTERAMAFAKANPDPNGGAAEALARAVKATRFGCNWHGGHKAYSKPAQELLQAKFKGTAWAGQTPYWFDCLNHKWPENDAGTEKVPTCEVKTWPKQPLPR